MPQEIKALVAELTREIETVKSARDSFTRYTGRTSVDGRRKIETVSNHVVARERLELLQSLLDETEQLGPVKDIGMQVRRLRAQVPHGTLQYKVTAPGSGSVV